MSKSESTVINPNKLLLSKWTAVQPVNQQKHFLVTRMVRNAEEQIVGCILEAVIDHQEVEVDWQNLKDRAVWLQGWL